MASLLQQDQRFGVSGNPILSKSMNTLNRLLDPSQNRVSALPRLQQERDILSAEQQKKAAFRGDFAAGGLTGSKALGVLDEAVANTTTTQLAQAQEQENELQELQDRAAINAYLSLVLQPSITGAQQNEEEINLQNQLRHLRRSRRSGQILGALQIIGGIALSFVPGGGLIGAGLISSGAGTLLGNT